MFTVITKTIASARSRAEAITIYIYIWSESKCNHKRQLKREIMHNVGNNNSMQHTIANLLKSSCRSIIYARSKRNRNGNELRPSWIEIEIEQGQKL